MYCYGCFQVLSLSFENILSFVLSLDFIGFTQDFLEIKALSRAVLKKKILQSS